MLLTWQPSTLSMATVGTTPVHCTCSKYWCCDNTSHTLGSAKKNSTAGFDSAAGCHMHEGVHVIMYALDRRAPAQICC